MGVEMEDAEGFRSHRLAAGGRCTWFSEAFRARHAARSTQGAHLWGGAEADLIDVPAGGLEAIVGVLCSTWGRGQGHFYKAVQELWGSTVLPAIFRRRCIPQAAGPHTHLRHCTHPLSTHLQ